MVQTPDDYRKRKGTVGKAYQPAVFVEICAIELEPLREAILEAYNRPVKQLYELVKPVDPSVNYRDALGVEFLRLALLLPADKNAKTGFHVFKIAETCMFAVGRADGFAVFIYSQKHKCPICVCLCAERRHYWISTDEIAMFDKLAELSAITKLGL